MVSEMASTDDGDISSHQGQSVIACTVVMLALATVTVALRLYTRRSILGSLGSDDWIVLAALFFSVGVSIGTIRQTNLGLGRHFSQVTSQEFSQFRMEEWYTFLLYATSLSFTKMSILLLYRRFMLLGLARLCNTIVLATVVACSLWVVVSSFIACVPLVAVWDSSVGGFCLPFEVNISSAYLHIATDFVILLLPIPVVVKLSLPWQQKVGLVLVFAVGFVACLISVLRVVSIAAIDLADPTYGLATIAKWGSVEVNLAIVCACLTTLKPLIARLFPRLLKSTYGTLGPASYPDRSAAAVPAGPNGDAARASRIRLGGENGAWSDLKLEVPPERSPGGSDDEEGCEMEDLGNQIRRGIYIDGISVSAPPKAYSKLP